MLEIKDIVNEVKIYDLEETLVFSGLPMRTTAQMSDVTDKDITRCTKLVNLMGNGNQAHGQFLTGIRVAFNLTFSNKAWVEAERYRFLEFISSQSTMHRIAKFDLDKQYMEYVDKRIIEIMKEKVADFNATEDAELKKQKYLEILYSNPCGFRLTARMTTNYRCLRNIYKQRKDHRLPEWVVFCKWIETLPYAKEFLIN